MSSISRTRSKKCRSYLKQARLVRCCHRALAIPWLSEPHAGSPPIRGAISSIVSRPANEATYRQFERAMPSARIVHCRSEGDDCAPGLGDLRGRLGLLLRSSCESYSSCRTSGWSVANTVNRDKIMGGTSIRTKYVAPIFLASS